MLTATPWYFLPQFRPARLQDCVLWLESDSFNGGIWHNLAPNFSNLNHGTAHGGVGLSQWHPQFPPAPTFYGDDEYVEVPDDDSLDISTNEEFTFEFLFKTFSSNNQILITHYGIDRLRCRILGSGHLSVGFYSSESGWEWTYNESVGYNDGAWHQVILVINAGNVKFFIDGTIDGEVNLTHDYTDIDSFIRIGQEYGSDTFFQGLIDELRIYKAALTHAEVVHNYTHHPLYYLQRGIDPYEVLTAATAAAAPSI